jgi:hypothetical protein
VCSHQGQIKSRSGIKTLPSNSTLRFFYHCVDVYVASGSVPSDCHDSFNTNAKISQGLWGWGEMGWVEQADGEGRLTQYVTFTLRSLTGVTS